MKALIYLFVGSIFGLVLFKSEAVSWYRIYEMFHFHSFHMYGIIGSAVILGALGIAIIKRKKINSFSGEPIHIADKNKGWKRYLWGGIIFGLGWALIGACPGPLFVLLGTGALKILIAIAFAILGTFLYGLIKDKLPH